MREGSVPTREVGSSPMELAQILALAKKHLGDMTGLKPVTVTQVFKDEDGWHVGVEMLEMSRIPPASDILGSYDVTLSEEGEVVRMDRRGTRLRGESRQNGNGS
ncbi:MAG: gas vesicle protein GvpO [Dehalococcoidia bacterium]|nr:gas vesicle protein GvpO [Dehalococcoidia bacterium]